MTTMINLKHLILKTTQRIISIGSLVYSHLEHFITVMLATASEPAYDNTARKYIDANLAIPTLRSIISKNHNVLQREKARHKPVS